jgi:hypothetical protein
MVNSENMTRPSNSYRLLVLGAILLVIGLVGVGIFSFGGRGAPFAANAEGDGLWQGLIVIASALFTGVGLTTLVVALIKRSRRR